MPGGPASLDTADLAGLYLSISHELGLRVSKETLVKRETKFISRDVSLKWWSLHQKIITLSFSKMLNNPKSYSFFRDSLTKFFFICTHRNESSRNVLLILKKFSPILIPL